MTTVWLVRHAEAEGNLCRRIHGHFDTNITYNGMKQIIQLQKRFETIPVDACYSSDLTRTMTTAQAIYIPKGLNLVTDPAFREVYLGTWEDQTFGYLNTYDAENLRDFNADPKNWHVENSERYLAYTGRFLTALKELCHRYEGQSIAVVSHGAVLRGLFTELFPRMDAGHSDNTAVSKLEYENGIFTPVFLNDNSHLSEETSTFARQKWWRKDGGIEDDALWFEQKECLCYFAYLGHEQVGQICCSEEDEVSGRIEYLELLPQYRRRGFCVQLLGQAIFTMRSIGKKRLFICTEDNAALCAACRKLYFIGSGQEDWILDLSVGVRSI